jgi:hypothetical protein
MNEPLITMPEPQQEVKISYSFVLNSSTDRELDITIKDDGNVVVVASSNERQPLHIHPSPNLLSAKMPLADDADIETVKVNVVGDKLTVIFSRMSDGNLSLIKDRKLFVQAD